MRPRGHLLVRDPEYERKLLMSIRLAQSADRKPNA
jgi:hypothetical protein